VLQPPSSLRAPAALPPAPLGPLPLMLAPPAPDALLAPPAPLEAGTSLKPSAGIQPGLPSW
jgi:hypothetical protein